MDHWPIASFRELEEGSGPRIIHETHSPYSLRIQQSRTYTATAFFFPGIVSPEDTDSHLVALFYLGTNCCRSCWYWYCFWVGIEGCHELKHRMPLLVKSNGQAEEYKCIDTRCWFEESYSCGWLQQCAPFEQVVVMKGSILLSRLPKKTVQFCFKWSIVQLGSWSEAILIQLWIVMHAGPTSRRM
jgi:hypothetical protein